MIWTVHDLKVVRKMVPHNEGDVGTPVVKFGCHGNVVLGLSTNDFTKNSYPYYYMFQVCSIDGLRPPTSPFTSIFLYD